MSHYAVLVRADGCADEEQAREAAEGFGYRHSSGGVSKNVNINLNIKQYLKLLREFNTDPGFNATEFQLLLECGTDIKEICSIDALESIFIDNGGYDVKSKTFSNLGMESEVLSKAITDILHEDPNCRRAFYSNNPETIGVTFNHIEYQKNLVSLNMWLRFGCEEWDYASAKDTWCGLDIACAKNKVKDFCSMFYCYGIADSDELYFIEYEGDEPPKKFWDNINSRTYFIILDIHI